MFGEAVPTATPIFDPSHPSNSISVIIPVYNGAAFIAQTLDSVLTQTVHPAEVIVINDGSTDNSASVVEEYGDSVTFINTPNGAQVRRETQVCPGRRGTGLRSAIATLPTGRATPDRWIRRAIDAIERMRRSPAIAVVLGVTRPIFRSLSASATSDPSAFFVIEAALH
jgi:cellulose synthase/poly-beta-1,6-N-acetylglucosamine synthase-like glycosyltransferase